MTTKGPFSYLSLYLKVQFVRLLQSSMIRIIRFVKGVKPLVFEPFETISIPSTKGNRRIRVDVYRNKAAQQPNVGPVAVHLNWHGSGFVFYAFGQNKPFISYLFNHELLADYPLIVLDCDYAKSPEYPFPAPLEDARDVLDYVFASPSLYDTSKVTLSGFSAGGNLALTTGTSVGEDVRLGKWHYGSRNSTNEQTVLPRAEHPIKAVITCYPLAKWVVPSIPMNAVKVPEHDKDHPGILLPPWVTNLLDASYWFPHSLDSPELAAAIQRGTVSPAMAQTSDFPKEVVLITSEYDTLTKDTEELRERLTREGKQVGGRMIKGVGHGWDNLTFPGQRGFQEKVEAYNMAAEAIRRAGNP
ncbi:alpha/beta-hydrolase [Serendipita vermifera]|nr:alpha/beta-hydrolase [Serendipita vermifera]